MPGNMGQSSPLSRKGMSSSRHEWQTRDTAPPDIPCRSLHELQTTPLHLRHVCLHRKKENGLVHCWQCVCFVLVPAVGVGELARVGETGRDPDRGWGNASSLSSSEPKSDP